MVLKALRVTLCWCALLSAPATCLAQAPPVDDDSLKPKSRRAPTEPRVLDPVREVNVRELKTASGEKGKIVIGSGDGHVVIVCPDSNRVWDGNTLGGFKDLLAGKTVTNAHVINRMNLFINEGRTKKDLDITNITKPEQLSEYVNRYVKEGAPISHSWTASDREDHGDLTKNVVRWFQVRMTSDQKALKDIAKDYTPPAAPTVWHQNNRCNDFVQTAAPVVKDLVKEDVTPGTDHKVPEVNATNIDKALKTRSDETNKATPQMSLGGAKAPLPAFRGDETKKITPPPPPGSVGKPAVGGVKMPLDLDPTGVRRETGTTCPKKQISKNPPLPVKDK